jgi:superfamily II DNA or RNA helicase
VAASTPFAYTLRDYQQEADAWLEAHPHAIYADDTGLGKTPTALATAARHLPALVVAPAYLMQQWFDVACAALPDAHILMPEGHSTRRRGELRSAADLYIVNYHTLRTTPLPPVETVLFDEAHRLRVRDSGQGTAGRELCWNTNRSYLLTGTPYYKGDQDIWHLLHCVAPERFSSYWDFIREWFTVNWYAPHTPKIYGVSRKKRADFEALVSHYMLMRTYETVGRTLPPLEEHTLTFDMPAPLLREYRALKKKWQLLGEPIESVGAVYALLRALTMCHLKLNIVKEVVDSIPRMEGVLVYCHYLESAHTLANAFKRGGPTEVPVMMITGETPPTERARMLSDQKRTRHPRIIVATIGALQEGQNMEHIRHVVYAEETYVRGEHTQTIARTRRDRGDEQQTNQPPVIVYYVRARKTIDEQIPHIRNSRGNAGDHELARRLRVNE